MKKNGFRWILLLCSCIAFLLAGVIYAWSSLKGSFVEEFGWNGAALSFNYTLTLIFFCLGGLVSGLAAKRLSPKVRMMISGLSLFAGFAIVSTLSAEQIGLLYVGYGFLAGTGIGIAYNTLIAVTNAFFPDRKGLCSGCLMMSFGFSALLIGKAVAAANAVLSWRQTFLLLGGLIGLVLLLTGFVLRAPRDGEVPQVQKKATAGGVDYTPAQMLRRSSFYRLFLFFFLLASVGSTAIGMARETLSAAGGTQELTVTVVGLISICNGLGRLTSGAMFDRFGLRRTQYLTSAVAILAPVTVWIGLGTGLLPLCVAGLCLCGFSYGFSPTVTVAFADAFYGRKHFGLNLPILNLVLIPASLMTTLFSALPTLQSVYIVLACFSLAGLVVNVSIRKA